MGREPPAFSEARQFVETLAIRGLPDQDIRQKLKVAGWSEGALNQLWYHVLEVRRRHAELVRRLVDSLAEARSKPWAGEDPDPYFWASHDVGSQLWGLGLGALQELRRLQEDGRAEIAEEARWLFWRIRVQYPLSWKDAVERVAALNAQGTWDTDIIASTLNQEGFRTRGGDELDVAAVISLQKEASSGIDGWELERLDDTDE